jgi:hypothetical protein
MSPNLLIAVPKKTLKVQRSGFKVKHTLPNDRSFMRRLVRFTAYQRMFPEYVEDRFDGCRMIGLKNPPSPCSNLQ